MPLKILKQCHKIAHNITTKNPLMVNVSSSLSTAIFDCRIYSN